jgi:hypothetical protein
VSILSSEVCRAANLHEAIQFFNFRSAYFLMISFKVLRLPALQAALLRNLVSGILLIKCLLLSRYNYNDCMFFYEEKITVAVWEHRALDLRFMDVDCSFHANSHSQLI